MTKRGELNPRQQQFVKFYLQTLNATQSLIKAGYKTKYPASLASQLLNKPYIAKEIERTKHAVAEYQNQLLKTKLGLAPITFDENISYLRSIIVDVDSDNKDKIAAIKEVNAMCGYLAPIQTQNTNVNVDLNKVQELTKQLMQDGSLKIDHKGEEILELPVSNLTGNIENAQINNDLENTMECQKSSNSQNSD